VKPDARIAMEEIFESVTSVCTDCSGKLQCARIDMEFVDQS